MCAFRKQCISTELQRGRCVTCTQVICDQNLYRPSVQGVQTLCQHHLIIGAITAENRYKNQLKINSLRTNFLHSLKEYSVILTTSFYGMSQKIKTKKCLFCRSQLLNLAHTLRITGVKLIMECLWTAERFVIFQLFLI